MARRSIEVDGDRWVVYPSGRITVYDRDEFALIFEKGTGPNRVRRVSRFSPRGACRWDAALAELSDDYLSQLLHASQIAGTSPEAGYQRNRG